MARTSAGILMFRYTERGAEVLLVHPGGPFWAKKDLGSWSIPKGECREGEDVRATAVREFEEELGSAVGGSFVPLNPVQQKGGKEVWAWAVEGNLDASRIRSNEFRMEWPPKSGRIQSFPEVDRAEWFSLETAAGKINPAQRAFLEELADELNVDSPTVGGVRRNDGERDG